MVGVGMTVNGSVCDRFIMVGEKIRLQRINAEELLVDFMTCPVCLVAAGEESTENVASKISIVHRHR